MLGFSSLQMGQPRLKCQFIAANHAAIDGSGNSVPGFSGASAGDLAVVIGERASTTPPAGWTLAGSFMAGIFTAPVFYEVLTSGDISSPATFTGSTGGAYTALVYRGPKTVSIVATQPWTTSDTSTSVSGAKPAGTKGIVVAAVSSTGTSLSGAPSGMTLRDNFNPGGVCIGAADFTSALKYGGAPLTWTGFSSSSGTLALLSLV